MIRGLVGVVPCHQMETGRFYLAPAYSGSWLFQCIQTSEPFDDTFRRKALMVANDGKPELGLYNLPDRIPLAALIDTHVRVDPTSLDGDANTAPLGRGTFLLSAAEPIVCAPLGTSAREWAAVNIATGRTVDNNLGYDWLSFKRWSIVMDDEAGDEITIVSFGEDKLDPASAG